MWLREGRCVAGGSASGTGRCRRPSHPPPPPLPPWLVTTYKLLPPLATYIQCHWCSGEKKLWTGNYLKLLPLVATLKPTNSGEMNKIPAMSLAWCSCEEKRQIRNQLGWANNCHLAFRNQQTIVATVPTYIPSWSPNSTDLYFWYLFVESTVNSQQTNRQIQKT